MVGYNPFIRTIYYLQYDLNFNISEASMSVLTSVCMGVCVSEVILLNEIKNKECSYR